MTDIPPGPRGAARLVTFDVDSDGIVNVSACDKATHREQAMRVVFFGLGPDEIARLIESAVQNEKADRVMQKDVILNKTRLDGLLCENTRRAFTEFGLCSSEEDQVLARSLIAACRTCLPQR